uniref:Uncharacterized protein n=1 Tax=Trypanosoma congolense (strain IL3000) TaxID=1068625 RepID=G0US67_TRYCI|nr:conserved hypothetical protein [Trypanosoma congolense IL3000]
MPPRGSVTLPRQRFRSLAFSAEDQEAALSEWKAKAQAGGEILKRISSKISCQRKSAGDATRSGRWLAEGVALERETVSCELDFEKAWAACSSLLQESVLQERSNMAEEREKLHESLTNLVVTVRKESNELCSKSSNVQRSDVEAMRDRLAALRESFSESVRVIEHQAETIMEEIEDPGRCSPTETIQLLVQSSIDVLEGVCESMVNKPGSSLVRTYKDAIEAEGDSVLAQLASQECESIPAGLSVRDMRKVSVVLRTYGNISSVDSDKPLLPGDLYSRVQQILPDISGDDVRLAVDEVLQQKRRKACARSLVFQFRKKCLELLRSFEKAVVADEEIGKMVESVEREARLREERQQKLHKELNELRAVREAEELVRREEEEERKREEEEKTQKINRLREIEYQERLKQLRLYQEQQKELQQRELALKEALAEEEAIKRAIRIERNGRRVLERQREYEEKCRTRKKRHEELNAMKIAHQKTLEAFFQNVRDQLGVASDPERVLQGTASSKQNEAFISFAEASRYSIYGYTIDDMAKDPRFRLQLALLEAGLHQTAYGREVLSQGYRVPAAQKPSEDNPLHSRV